MSRKTLVYICAPFSGEVFKNINSAIKYAKYVFEQGATPVTPHILFPFLDDEKNRDEALEMDLEILKKCKEIWVFGDNVTSGMKTEIEVASKEKIAIKFIKYEGRI